MELETYSFLHTLILFIVISFSIATVFFMTDPGWYVFKKYFERTTVIRCKFKDPHSFEVKEWKAILMKSPDGCLYTYRYPRSKIGYTSLNPEGTGLYLSWEITWEKI